MKLKISLLKAINHGGIAGLEIGMDSMHFAKRKHDNPRALCFDAARVLRECAAKFEMLGEGPEPFNVKTQAKINRVKVCA